MKRLAFFLIVAVTLVLAACQSATPTAELLPTATTVVLPTVTIAPSLTPPPANTPTSEPPTATPLPAETATPTVPATPDPNERVGEVVYADPLDGTGNWYWTFEDDTAHFKVSLENKQLEAMAKQSGSWRYTISNDTLKVSDQQLRVTARVETCGDTDEYALLFRGQVDAQNTSSFYVFKLRCNGAARAELMQGTRITTLAEWTTSPAIKAGAKAENVLTVWAYKGELRFYVNDEYLFSAQETTLTEGFYGFFLMDKTNGNMMVKWSGLEARGIKAP